MAEKKLSCPAPAAPHASKSMVKGEVASCCTYLGSPKANSSSKLEVGLVKMRVTSLACCFFSCSPLASSVGVGPSACEMNHVCVSFLCTMTRVLSAGNLYWNALAFSIMTIPLQRGWLTSDSSRPLTPMSFRLNSIRESTALEGFSLGESDQTKVKRSRVREPKAMLIRPKPPTRPLSLAPLGALYPASPPTPVPPTTPPVPISTPTEETLCSSCL